MSPITSGFYDLDQFRPKQILEENASTIAKEVDLVPIDNMLPWHEESILAGQWFLQPILLHDIVFGTYANYLSYTLGKLKELGCIQAGISVLKSDSKILPHTDIVEDDVLLSSKTYRLQLGIDVPEGCELTVNNDLEEPETRPWENGKVLAFDSSRIHSAINPSNKHRIILIADFPKSEDAVTAEELNNLKLYYMKLYGLV